MGDAVAVYGVGHSFGMYHPLRGKTKKILQQDLGVLRHQHFAGFGLGLQAGGNIDCPADGGVIQPTGAAEITDIAKSRIDPDPDLQIHGKAELLSDIRLQRDDSHLHLYRHIDAVLGILHIALGFRVAKENHNGIANKLIDSAAELFGDGAHLCEIKAQELTDLLGFDLLGDGGEIDNIGKKNGELLALALFMDI